ncbi:MAG: antibiotic biosynthesis monooxygenase [Bacteroidales bacterium]|nr:antibiotic biosynthesis monooxygenase [Bacteroidales bacterium]
MLRLNVFFTLADQANKEAAEKAGKELVAASLNDNGCIGYDMLASTTRPGEYMIIETWQDAPSLEAHMNAPHFTTLVPRLQELGEMRIEQFEF